MFKAIIRLFSQAKRDEHHKKLINDRLDVISRIKVTLVEARGYEKRRGSVYVSSLIVPTKLMSLLHHWELAEVLELNDIITINNKVHPRDCGKWIIYKPSYLIVDVDMEQEPIKTLEKKFMRYEHLSRRDKSQFMIGYVDPKLR